MQEKDAIKEAFVKVKEDIALLKEILTLIQKELEQLKHLQQTNQHINPTQKPNNSTVNTNPTHNPTDNLPLKPLKTQYNTTSIRNDRVPTDRQTDKQTDTSTGNKGVINSLDNLKKELRWTFKKLTNQEMTVFSTIYQLEEQGFTVDYSLISQKLSLSESSVRDYIQRILKKGIPILKYKENNKKVLLSVSPELKKIASLEVIQQLRAL